ncbi:unnamed protein product [Lactuca virosa]|uniref:Uncharacterized protein n=1 Tax=Lactuca virosa TaxID=75947 RepID=A0AAU9LGB8_9ASTR|nr:unnamed protein product [Lactuca virosa]
MVGRDGVSAVEDPQCPITGENGLILSSLKAYVKNLDSIGRIDVIEFNLCEIQLTNSIVQKSILDILIRT